MRKNKKILIIAMIVVLGAVCGVLKLSKIEKVEILSESAKKEQFKSYSEEFVQMDEKVLTRQNLAEESDNAEENIYEEGKAIIIYKSNNFFTNLKVSTMSLFNNYEVEETIELGKLDIDNSSSSSENEITVATVSSDKYSTEELVEKLREKSWVISAIPNYQFKTLGLTNDEYADIQWAIQNDGQFAGTAGDDISSITTSSETEKVIAIVDTGVDYTNEDLVNVMWKNPFDEETLPGTYGYDFANDDNDPIDDNGHGTHCAGIIAAEANNGVGISGAVLGASNIKIMALKVSDASGSMDLNDIISAYQYIFQAQELGVNIVAINNSWGTILELGTSQDDAIQEVKDLFEQIVEQAGKNGAISVFAAGNNGFELDEDGVYDKGSKEYLAFPACLENDYEITVAATDSNDELGYFSNYGDVVDMAAPGVDIYSTYKSGYSFNPDSSKKEEYCLYEDFEGDSSDLVDKITPYIVEYDEVYNMTFNDGTSIYSVEVTDEKFYGDSGNALKITVDKSMNDKYVYLRLPLSEFGITDFNTYAVSLDLYVTQETGGAGTRSPEYGFTYNGSCILSLENEEASYYYDLGSTVVSKSDYWHHWNGVYTLNDYVACEYLDIILYGIVGNGQYTIYVDNLVITKDLDEDYKKVLTSYELLSGTSMAAPHVTASVAVASNQYEDYTAKEIKDLILNGSRDKENFTEVVKYGTLDMQSFLKTQEIGLVYGDSKYNYDGKEHSINLNVVEPTTGVEIYYSTEQELTAENYLEGNTKKPTYTNPGEYTVYWYVHSTNGEYIDRSGNCKVVIDRKIIIDAYNYNGTYDTKEHSISLYSDIQTNEIELYYSTEQELTSENYNTVGTTTKPTFADAGEYTIYWYAYSTDGTLEDASGKNIVYINPIHIGLNLDNEYTERELTGEREGWNLIELKLGSTSYIYTGTEINPIGTLTFREKELIEGKDYTVEYYLSDYDENNYPTYETAVEPIVANQKYLARIKGMGNFYGSLTTEDFTIESRNITITAKDQKILDGNQIRTGVEAITIGEDGLAENQAISEITIESTVGEDNQDIIKVSNAIIEDSSNNDVTSNYNINYVDGNLTICSNDDVIEIQFNDIGLYKSIILDNSIETVYEDEENKKITFEKNIIEQTESISLYDNYGKITDLTGLSSFYNLKSLYMKNVDLTDIAEIEKILELPNITEIKTDSSYNIEEMESNDEKMFLSPFLQLTAQTQNDAKITAYIYYGENGESEISVNKDEDGRLYVVLDYTASESKPAGDRIIRFEVSGGITDDSTCSVLYNVEAPLTNFETIKKAESEYIVLSPENNNSVENILTRDNFPNTNYEISAIDINGNTLIDNGKITTGMKIELKSENESKIFTLIVRGDTNGDGMSDFKDILSINKHRLNIGELEDAFLIAGDVNNDESVDFKDILEINKFRLGIITEL